MRQLQSTQTTPQPPPAPPSSDASCKITPQNASQKSEASPQPKETKELKTAPKLNSISPFFASLASLPFPASRETHLVKSPLKMRLPIYRLVRNPHNQRNLQAHGK